MPLSLTMPSKVAEQQGGDADGSSTNSLHVKTSSSLTADQRYPAWMCLTMFSAICVATQQSRRGMFDADEARVLSLFVTSFILSIIAIGMYLRCSASFVGQVPEILMVRLLLHDCFVCSPIYRQLSSFVIEIGAVGCLFEI